MKSFAFAAVIATASAISQIELKYVNYLAEFGKIANDVDEFNMRMENFAITDEFIEEHNSGTSDSTHVAGHNQFSDWTHAEYLAILGDRDDEPHNLGEIEIFDENTAENSVNWVSKGAVTGVKNQAHCGSCWAFSAVGALEGAHFIATKSLKSFSEQQLVSCDTSNHGCDGGDKTRSFVYWETHNAELESVYPYTSGSGSVASCKYNKSSATSVKVSAYKKVTADSVSQMKSALTKQPLSVSIEASSSVFKTYKSGIISSSTCGTSTNHAITAVGYGSENGQEYWLVKNSWNTTWGEKGYGKIAIKDGMGICGIQKKPAFPTAN